jgi:hypothetical protein
VFSVLSARTSFARVVPPRALSAFDACERIALRAVLDHFARHVVIHETPSSSLVSRNQNWNCLAATLLRLTVNQVVHFESEGLSSSRTMAGKGGFGKSLAKKGRAYRNEKSRSAAASVGIAAARNLRGQRLGADGAAQTVAQMAADKRSGRFRRIEDQRSGLEGKADTNRAKRGRDVQQHEATSGSGTDDEGADERVREAVAVQRQLYRATVNNCVECVRSAVAHLQNRVKAGETQIKMIPTTDLLSVLTELDVAVDAT